MRPATWGQRGMGMQAAAGPASAGHLSGPANSVEHGPDEGMRPLPSRQSSPVSRSYTATPGSQAPASSAAPPPWEEDELSEVVELVSGSPPPCRTSGAATASCCHDRSKWAPQSWEWARCAPMSYALCGSAFTLESRDAGHADANSTAPVPSSPPCLHGVWVVGHVRQPHGQLLHHRSHPAHTRPVSIGASAGRPLAMAAEPQ